MAMNDYQHERLPHHHRRPPRGDLLPASQGARHHLARLPHHRRRRRHRTSWGTLPGLIIVFGLVFAITFTRKASPALALGLFLALTYFMGWQIGPLIQHYIHNFGTDIVFNAAATTAAGMAVMGCIAYLFNINYRRIAGIGIRRAAPASSSPASPACSSTSSRPDTFSWLTLGIFSLLTIGDFARIRAGGDGRSAVSLALSIYLDAINIFLAVLQLMGGRRSRS